MRIKKLQLVPNIYMLQQFPALRDNNIHRLYYFELYDKWNNLCNYYAFSIVCLQMKPTNFVKVLKSKFDAIEYRYNFYFMNENNINNAIEWVESIIVLNNLTGH